MHEWRHPQHPWQHPHDERFDRFKETSEWHPRYRIEYNPHGDTLDRFVLKVSAELETIYHLLNRLRSLDAAGDDTDTTPYQLRFDAENGTLLIRDAENKNWLELVKLGENSSDIKPEKPASGNVADIPQNAEPNQLFYARDMNKVYFYTDTGWWKVLANLNTVDKQITADDVSNRGK